MAISFLAHYEVFELLAHHVLPHLCGAWLAGSFKAAQLALHV